MAVEQAARRLRLWSILVIVGVFLAGAVAGAGLFAWLRPGRQWRPHRRDLPALFSELNLTPEQREKATAIFDKHRAVIESILKANFPRVRAEEEQSNRELREILTDAQRKKLDEIEARPRPGRHRGGIGRPGEHQPVGNGAAPGERRPDGEASGDPPPAPQPR